MTARPATRRDAFSLQNGTRHHKSYPTKRYLDAVVLFSMFTT
jgi:hypothetical protein